MIENIIINIVYVLFFIYVNTRLNNVQYLLSLIFLVKMYDKYWFSFYSFPEIMQEKWGIKHYTQLFENEMITSNSLFLKLQKKLTKLLNSLKLKDKDIILAIS